MGACFQKQGRDKVENTKASAVVPSWGSSPTYTDDDAGKVNLAGDVLCPFTQRIRIALQHKGVPVKATMIRGDDLHSSKSDLAAISQDGRYPALQHGNRKISGSTEAILEYIEQTFRDVPLVPRGMEREVKQWVLYIRDTFTPLVEQYLHDGNPFLLEEMEPKLNDAFAHLDSGIEVHEQEGQFFLGCQFTLVDVYLIPFLVELDVATYYRGFGISSSHSKLLAYKSIMRTFKSYIPVHVDERLLRQSLMERITGRPPQPLVTITILQHRSILRQLERFVELVKGLEIKNREGPLEDAKQRTAFGLKLRGLPKSYGRLLDLMQDHAQMEERIIFPALEVADPDLTTTALREHARDLPVMNGIREDLKGVTALRQGTWDHIEAFSALNSRLEILQANSMEHFQEEEREQLQLLEAAGLDTKKQEELVDQALPLQEMTHFTLLPYLLQGLLPFEVHQYLGLMIQYTVRERISILPRIVHSLGDDEWLDVWRVAKDRVPSLSVD